MSRYYFYTRHMYPAMMKESLTVDTRHFGKVHVGYLKYRIDASNKKLRKVV